MVQRKRVIMMEEILHENEKLIKKVNKVLKELKSNEKNYFKLLKYYYSPDWENDKNDFENGILNDLETASVLGEDDIYNMMITKQSLAITMLEIGTKIIKK